MLTFDFDRLAIGPGVRVLDLGCGAGRHAFEAYKRGAEVVAADLDARELESVAAMLAALAAEPGANGDSLRRRGAGPAEDLASGAVLRSGRGWSTVVADALALPFPDASFDRVIVSEVFEHIRADRQAIAEVSRVLRPGAMAAVSVPRWWPEQVCWALSDEYHRNPGGHCRIYRGSDLEACLTEAGLEVIGRAHSHALHAPYWWLKCLFGVRRERALLPSLYHRLLVWDLVHAPAWLRRLEADLNPVLGKSLVLYLVKPPTSRSEPRPAIRTAARVDAHRVEAPA